MKISKINKLDDFYERYDLCVPETNCFIANGIVVHNTSANINYFDGKLTFFSGGVNHQQFVDLFNQEELLSKFSTHEYFASKKVTVYGEAFGGKCQGMSKVYGPDLRFISFDVKVDDVWLDVPSAEAVVKMLGLQFVPYNKGPLTIEWLNSQRDLPSQVAIVPDAMREGVVIRPLHEMKTNSGERFIAKHKREEFRETKSPREIDPDQLKVLSDASEVAEEWVVVHRLEHILQKTPYNSPEDTKSVINAMIEDVKLESVGEVEWSKQIEKSIGRKTVQLLKEKIKCY